MAGYSKMLYARTFFPDEVDTLSAKAQNDMLGLPQESFDEATKRGVALVEGLQQRAERMAS